MTPRAILLKAAERIDTGHDVLCCIAIEDAAGSYEAAGVADRHFKRMYCPWNSQNMVVNTGMDFWSKHITPENQKLRTMCLLFAAWSYEP